MVFWKGVREDYFRRYFSNLGGLVYGNSGGRSEKWLNFVCVLNIELIGFVNELDIECEIKKSLE